MSVGGAPTEPAGMARYAALVSQYEKQLGDVDNMVAAFKDALQVALSESRDVVEVEGLHMHGLVYAMVGHAEQFLVSLRALKHSRVLHDGPFINTTVELNNMRYASASQERLAFVKRMLADVEMRLMQLEGHANRLRSLAKGQAPALPVAVEDAGLAVAGEGDATAMTL